MELNDYVPCICFKKQHHLLYLFILRDKKDTLATNHFHYFWNPPSFTMNRMCLNLNVSLNSHNDVKRHVLHIIRFTIISFQSRLREHTLNAKCLHRTLATTILFNLKTTFDLLDEWVISNRWGNISINPHRNFKMFPL